jgi:hypothetical protein
MDLSYPLIYIVWPDVVACYSGLHVLLPFLMTCSAVACRSSVL